MLDLQKLDEMITQQTRNGRQEVYLPVGIIKELDPTFVPNKEIDGRTFINVSTIEHLISEYRKNEFKRSLKVGQGEMKLVDSNDGKFRFEPIEDRGR